MAVLLPSTSAESHLQDHMTDAHGQSDSSGLSDRSTDVAPEATSKRPKLSLQTSALTNTYGTLTRGLGPNLGAQATFTPTTANTFANTWDLSIRPSPISRTESPRPQPARIQTLQQPYSISLPFGVKPILKNSPLPPRQGSVSASPRESRRKVFFPQPKHVVFKRNLEDVIETKQYVARHSDLTSSEEDSSEEERQSSTSPLPTHDDDPPSFQHSPPPSRKRKSRRDSGVYVDTDARDAQSTPSEESASSRPTKDHKRPRRQWPPARQEATTDEFEANKEHPDRHSAEANTSTRDTPVTTKQEVAQAVLFPKEPFADTLAVSAKSGRRDFPVSDNRSKDTTREAQRARRSS